MTTDFREYTVEAPTYDEVAARYAELNAQLDAAEAAEDATAFVDGVAAWDAYRRELSDWSATVSIRFHQDTANEEYKKAREYCDELSPKLTDLAVAMKRRLLSCGYRAALAERFGELVFELWSCDVAAFDPVIEQDLVAESKLNSEYTELVASARFEFQGETLTLSQLGKYAENPDREIRHGAARVASEWFADRQTDFDRLYQELVTLRHTMAGKLGYENFIPLGYKHMQRIDYGQADVETFRAQVRDEVVPLCLELRRRQAENLGLEKLYAWDEAIHDLAGNPKPDGEHDWLVDRATEMFEALGGGMDDFFAEMKQQHLMDLKSREGKASGGFCHNLPVLRMPFIFANFNGTKGDVEVFTHEMGHAFQCYSSREQPLTDYLWPTTEACEIHSMGLEFLTWPHMELFFGDDAARFRRLHLTESILFLPYGVLVDHFQHQVYEKPEATPEERNQMWLDLEAVYVPWRDYGDLAHPASGRRWQRQLHIYGMPFYYIDYTLALTCALQLWVRAETDREATMRDYVALCHRGGEAPFQELVAAAGLKSPFAPGCLSEVVARAKQELDLA